MALDVVADEAHLQRRLGVFNHGGCHHHRGHGIVRLIVELNPPYYAATPRHLLNTRVCMRAHNEVSSSCDLERFLFAWHHENKNGVKNGRKVTHFGKSCNFDAESQIKLWSVFCFLRTTKTKRCEKRTESHPFPKSSWHFGRRPSGNVLSWN